MPSQVDLERQERLAQFFQANTEIWEALVEEIELCLENARNQSESPSLVNRDFIGGECFGYRQILGFENQYKKWQKPKS